MSLCSKRSYFFVNQYVYFFRHMQNTYAVEISLKKVK